MNYQVNTTHNASFSLVRALTGHFSVLVFDSISGTLLCSLMHRSRFFLFVFVVSMASTWLCPTLML